MDTLRCIAGTALMHAPLALLPCSARSPPLPTSAKFHLVHLALTADARRWQASSPTTVVCRTRPRSAGTSSAMRGAGRLLLPPLLPEKYARGMSTWCSSSPACFPESITSVAPRRRRFGPMHLKTLRHVNGHVTIVRGRLRVNQKSYETLEDVTKSCTNKDHCPPTMAVPSIHSKVYHPTQRPEESSGFNPSQEVVSSVTSSIQ